MANGLIGVMPAFIGFAVITTTYLHPYFRFKNLWETLFTMFYNMFGDTSFDTFYGA